MTFKDIEQLYWTNPQQAKEELLKKASCDANGAFFLSVGNKFACVRNLISATQIPTQTTPIEIQLCVREGGTKIVAGWI